MKEFSKILVIMWLISAGVNLLSYFTSGFDIDKLLIVFLEILLAGWNYRDYKREDA